MFLDSDLENFDLDEEVLSGRSSVSQPSANFNTEMSNELNNVIVQSHKFSNEENTDEIELTTANPIDKLYRMHHTYFAFP